MTEKNLVIQSNEKSLAIGCLFAIISMGVSFYMTKILIMTNKTIDAPGMKGIRSRTEHGPLRQKREDTHVETIENQYGRNFGVRGDMHLGTLLEKEGVHSLNDLLTGK